MDDSDRPPESGSRGPFASLRRRSRRGRRRGETSSYAKWVIGGLLALLVVAGAWFLLRSGDGPGAGAPSAGERAPAPARTGPPEPGAVEPGIELPALAASDTLVRALAGGLSERPGWASWLGMDGLVRRFVLSVAGVSAGASPREHLEPLEPDDDFVARDAGGRTVVDPAGYRRYDLQAAIFASLDAEIAARLYRVLHPLFEEAHRELGLGERSFDETFARALGRLLAVEVPEGPVELVADGGVWAFRDPALESLSPAAKHLVRMGPENARRVQEKLRELAGAIGVEPLPPAGVEGAPL